MENVNNFCSIQSLDKLAKKYKIKLDSLNFMSMELKKFNQSNYPFKIKAFGLESRNDKLYDLVLMLIIKTHEDTTFDVKYYQDEMKKDKVVILSNKEYKEKERYWFVLFLDFFDVKKDTLIDYSGDLCQFPDYTKISKGLKNLLIRLKNVLWD